jgi:hypothetical protein
MLCFNLKSVKNPRAGHLSRQAGRSGSGTPESEKRFAYKFPSKSLVAARDADRHKRLAPSLKIRLLTFSNPDGR